MNRRRGILAAFVAFMATAKKDGLAQFYLGNMPDRATLTLLDLDLGGSTDPTKDIGIRITYRGETINVLMADVMNELRTLNRDVNESLPSNKAAG